MDSDSFADLFSPHPAHGTFRRHAGTRKALFIDSRKEPDSFLLATNFLLHPSQTANFSTTGSADQIALAMPALIANHQVEVVLVGSRTAFHTFTARTELIGFTGMLERACYKDLECTLSSMEGLDDEVEECSQLLQPFANAGPTAIVMSVVGTDYYVLCFNFKWRDSDDYNLKSSRSFSQLCDGVVQFVVANKGVSQFLFPEPYAFRRFCESPQLEHYAPLFHFLDKNEGAISYARAREILHDWDALQGDDDVTISPLREGELEGSGLFPWQGRFAKKHTGPSVPKIEAPASATRTLETSAIGFYFVARDSDDPAAHRAVVDFLKEVPQGDSGSRALPFAQMAAAIALKKLEKLSDARVMIDRALASAGAAHPYFNHALEEKVDILIELGVNERIVDEIGQQNIETTFEWANSHLAKAVPILQNMADRYPDNGNCWTALGTAFEKTGQERDAIEAYRKRLELDPFNRATFVSLRRLLDQQDDAGFAISVVDEILSRLPGKAQEEDEATPAERKIPDGIESVMHFKSDLLKTKLKIYEQVGDVDGRLRICNELIDHYETLNSKETARHETQLGRAPDDEYAWAVAQRAETYRLMGNHAAALADFGQAIELNDKWAWAIASRGQSYQDSGNVSVSGTR
jgi:tetratricopeptide (TPR) repeat protein